MRPVSSTARYCSIIALLVLAALWLGCDSDGNGPPGAGSTGSPTSSPQIVTASPPPFANPTVTTGILPAGFPDDFPIYENATPIGGSESSVGIVASLETRDAFDDVAAFYEDALNQLPWKITETSRTEGQQAILFTIANDDAGLAGTVSIVSPADSGKTLIVVNLHPS